MHQEKGQEREAQAAGNDLYRDLMKIFRQVGQMMMEGLPPDRILEQILQLTHEIFHADAGSIILKDPDRNKLVFQVVIGEKKSALQGRSMPLEKGIAGWVVRHGEPVILTDPRDDPRFYAQIDLELGYSTRNILCVPIPGKHEAIGVIELLNHREAFTDQDQHRLATIAGQAAILLENARLLEENRQSINNLERLISIIKEINSSQRLDDVLDLIMDNITTVVEAEAGSIMLIEERDGEKSLIFHTAKGEKGEAIKEIRVPLEGSIAGWVATHGESQLVADVSQDERHFKKTDQASGFETKSILAVPLQVKGETLGVVEAINKLTHESAAFREQDMDLFRAFSDQAAITIKNTRLYESVVRAYDGTLAALSAALDMRDHETEGHSQRVTRYTLALAEAIGMDRDANEQTWVNIERGALLHDIGKIGIPDQILLKPGKLTEAEWAVMKTHPELGYQILRGIDFLEGAIPIVYAHHERWDGFGYPRELTGEEIPLGARLFAIADTLDAMTVDRPYRKALPFAVAQEEIITNSESQFDPRAVEAFLSIPEERWVNIREGA